MVIPLNKVLNKICRMIFYILEILIIISLIKQVMLKNYDYVGICFATFLLMLLPNLIAIKSNIVIPESLKILFYLFLAGILGEVWHFYIYFKNYDIIIHVLSGFISMALGLFLIMFLFKIKNISKAVILFSICFSITMGLFWELVEYSTDKYIYTDHQKDTYLNTISSINLDKSKNGKPVKIENIAKTILYDKDNREVAVIETGYLDIGLNDTMLDLIANFIGACIYSILIYIIKNTFIEEFIIKSNNMIS